MLKDDLLNHLLFLGYEKGISWRGGRTHYIKLNDKQNRQVRFEEEQNKLHVICVKGMLSRTIAIYNMSNGAYILEEGGGTIGFYRQGALGKLDLQIRKFLQPASISFIQSLVEE